MILDAVTELFHEADSAEDAHLLDGGPSAPSRILEPTPDEAVVAASCAATDAFEAGYPEETVRLCFALWQLLDDESITAETRLVSTANLSGLFREIGAFRFSAELGQQAFVAALGGIRPDALPELGYGLAQTMLMGHEHLDLTEPERARWIDQAAQAALCIMEHAGEDRHRSVLGHGVMAEVCMTRGDVRGARRHLDVALDGMDRTRDPLAAVMMLIEAMVLRREGRLGAALQRFNLAKPALSLQWLRQLQLLTERGEAHAQSGDWERAYWDSRQAAELLTRHLNADIQHLVAELAQQRRTTVGMVAVAQEPAPDELDESEELIERLKNDELTGVGSGSWLSLALADRETSVGVAPVLVLDVDHMRGINDAHGFALGDTVLAVLGEILTNECRKSDVVARSEGNRFVVLPFDFGLTDSLSMAERLCRAVSSADWALLAPGLTVTVSVGVSSGLCADVRDTLRHAETYLDNAKADGRDRVAGPGHAKVEQLSST